MARTSGSPSSEIVGPVWQAASVEELIGTQKPMRRILDPDEAIAALERAVPGLVALRRQEPAVFDWRAVEEGAGRALPSDFKSLAEWYPAFDLDDFLAIMLPWPGEDIGRAKAEGTESKGWDSDYPAELRPLELVSTSLMPWGDSAEGDRFFWSVLGDDPEHWPVTICSRNGPWWHYEGGMVQFLAELCDGALDPWALPPVKPEITGWAVESGGWRQTA
ncbi:hypothetical protein [Streptomyces sp. NBC_01006]|uniref:hypothetical protein n=1 Tax=Streptomyces sp. NBC_01006 TaxID=2903716 RepID=UPI0038686A16|nr:hypothetical protein OG509_38250 [Streptomyces sp. NBC_01006]